MALRLYNTLSGKIEDFHPLDGNRVRMYACGPTVYDYGHMNSARRNGEKSPARRMSRRSSEDSDT